MTIPKTVQCMIGIEGAFAGMLFGPAETSKVLFMVMLGLAVLWGKAFIFND